MVAYRFCRPDDIPELVAAVNRCYDVHFGASPFTVDRFRREMRELQLWPSNSMLARAGDEPVAVVLGTKRASEVLVRRIGVAPGHQRQGHGKHLLDSLGHKLAVLGPPRLVAEVPLELAGARAFFAGAGWREEGMLHDYVRTPRQVVAATAAERPGGAPPPGWREVTVAELEEGGALRSSTLLAWERQPEGLRAAVDLRGLALGEAPLPASWALFRSAPAGGAEILRFGVPGDRAAEALLTLAGAVQEALPGPLRLWRLAEDEVGIEALAAHGFVLDSTFVRFATVAEAA